MTDRIEIGAGLWAEKEGGDLAYGIHAGQEIGVVGYIYDSGHYVGDGILMTPNELRAIADFMDTLKTKEGG